MVQSVEAKHDDTGEVTLMEARFVKSNLFHANLSSGNFSGVQFYRTILDHANLSGGIFNGAVFYACSMERTNLCMASFSGAKFLSANTAHPFYLQEIITPTDLSGANATRAIFTSADFTGANLQDIILTEANLMGAVFTGANMTGAQLNEAHFNLSQFTRKQVLSFHYEDKNAIQYVNAIYDYMEQNEEVNHQKEFERARLLLISIIDGHLLNPSNLSLFTRAQVLSFRYEDENAIQYVNAIYDYMEKNEEPMHKKGFERARQLLVSFINGQPFVRYKNHGVTPTLVI